MTTPSLNYILFPQEVFSEVERHPFQFFYNRCGMSYNALYMVSSKTRLKSWDFPNVIGLNEIYPKIDFSEFQSNCAIISRMFNKDFGDAWNAYNLQPQWAYVSLPTQTIARHFPQYVARGAGITLICFRDSKVKLEARLKLINTLLLPDISMYTLVD